MMMWDKATGGRTRRRIARPALVAAVGLASGIGGTVEAQTPEAWLLTGGNADLYRLRRDVEIARSGEASLRLAARGNRRRSEWAVSVQMVDATAYRGHRIRVRGYLRSDDVDSGGLWLRVDGIVDGKAAMLALDNTEDRRIEGTRDWTLQEIVVDIPPESVTILFGTMITGDGRLWADDVSFEEVSSSEEVTAAQDPVVTADPYQRPPGVFPVPTNLGFERMAPGS